MKVLFVCTGNTCRSAMAAAICNYLAKEQGADICADSCGVAAYPAPASRNAVLAVDELFGIDLNGHVAKMVNADLVNEADVIFAMTPRHAGALISAFPDCVDKLVVADPEIVDPYMQDLSVYKACAKELCEQIKERFFRKSEKIHIIPMTENEIEGIAELEKECFGSPWSAQSLKDELSNEGARFFAAVENGEVLGYIGCILVCGEGSITNVAVRKKARRKGIASQLLKALIEALKKEGAESVFLEVRVSNDAAQKLYEKFGFLVCGERRDFYKNPTENAYIMKLLLN